MADAPDRSRTPSDAAIDDVLARVREQILVLSGKGQTWKLTLHGGPHDIRIEYSATETVSLRQVHGPALKRVPGQ